MKDTIERAIDNLIETPAKRFRSSIYVDLWIPSTGDVESDRQAARAVVRKYQEQIPNSFIGGVAQYTGTSLDVEL